MRRRRHRRIAPSGSPRGRELLASSEGLGLPSVGSRSVGLERVQGTGSRANRGAGGWGPEIRPPLA